MSFGGQTALNCGVDLTERGTLDKYNVEVLGTPVTSIVMTEDRQKFASELATISEPVAPSLAAYSVTEVNIYYSSVCMVHVHVSIVITVFPSKKLFKEHTVVILCQSLLESPCILCRHSRLPSLLATQFLCGQHSPLVGWGQGLPLTLKRWKLLHSLPSLTLNRSVTLNVAMNVP